jgi:SAM-dependent methyltransferase
MAIDRISAEALALLPRGGSAPRSFLMLGRQHLMLTAFEWSAIAKRSSLELDPSLIEGLEMGGYAEPFLRWLGFEQVESMDFSEYEGCSLVHDLNQPVPEDWHNRFDVVFDGGTLEHVFHFPHAIGNAMRLVRPGGYFVSCTPSNNYNGHGFFQFSPELFCRIFEVANGFRLHLLSLVESTGSFATYRVPDPKQVGHRITFGGKGPLLMVFVAEKVAITDLFQTIPAQSDYAAVWEEASQNMGSRAIGVGGGNPLARLMRRWIPEAWLYRFRRYVAERDRAGRGLRGVEKVETLRECIVATRP